MQLVSSPSLGRNTVVKAAEGLVNVIAVKGRKGLNEGPGHHPHGELICINLPT